MIETHGVVNVALSPDQLERALEKQDGLELRSHGGPNPFSRTCGLEIEQFLLHRMQNFFHVPTVLGRLKCDEKILGLVTKTPTYDAKTPLSRFNFFEIYSDDIQRIKVLVRVFLDYFFELHLIHGPQYPEHLLREADQDVRPDSSFHFSNNLIIPKNLTIITSENDLLPKGIIERLHTCAPAGAIECIKSRTTIYQPPVSEKNRRLPDGCTWDLFAMGIILFGALSPSGSEFADYCLSTFSSLDSQTREKPETRYRRFLFDPVADVFGSKDDAMTFFASCTWIDPFPIGLVDETKSALQNLLTLSLSRWACLKPEGGYPELGSILSDIVRDTIQAPFSESEQPIQALEIFTNLWAIWQILHPEKSEAALITDTYPEFGLPRKFKSVSFPFRRLKIPFSSSPTKISTAALAGDLPLSSMTLDWRCSSLLNQRHVAIEEIEAIPGNRLAFPKVEIHPESDVNHIEFTCPGAPSQGVSRDALLEFGPYVHPILIMVDFEPGLVFPIFEKPLDLVNLETRVGELFPNGCLPDEDELSSVKALWNQCLEEFDPKFLESNRAGWYSAFAVLASNILMLPESLRQSHGLCPLITVQNKWQPHDLAKQISHLESKDGLLNFSFDASFSVAACLHLVKLCADAVEQGDFTSFDTILEILEGSLEEIRSSRKEEIFETVECLKSCREIHQIQRDANS